jgi:hypothetical protein
VCDRVTFDIYILKSLSVISFFSISLLIYWVGLQKDEADKDNLIKVSHKLMQVGASVLSHHQVDADARQLVVITGA